MPATEVDVRALHDRIQALEEQLAQRDAELADERRRHRGLRNRKAVRMALALASVRDRARRRTHRSAAPVLAPDDEPVAQAWEPGHFYSPVPDTRELAREPARSRIWCVPPRETPGVDWREEQQVELVRELGRQQPLHFPSGPTGDATEYHTGSPNFSELDAWALQGMLRYLRPRRVIEVGSGWSSLVTARVNREHFQGSTEVTCIEPYPPDFLAGGVAGIGRLIEAPVQNVPLETFARLDAGDVLFIDTSHVLKTGSDVQFLYQEVVPRLRPGVAVHAHDIFLPWDYPQEWVLGGRAWNEQYLIESFLAFNRAFEVLLSICWMSCFQRDVLTGAAGEAVQKGGGSLWIRRSAP
jgi:predicted O-methyltransferase YrrM